MDPLTAGLIATGAGTVMSADAELRAGRKAARQGIIQRAISEVDAQQATAVGQHKALEEQRQADLVASRTVAVAAAGGAAEDIDHLIADIKGEGVYRAQLAMYEAETQAEKIRYEGIQAEKRGYEARRASKRGAINTILKGGASMATMYSYGRSSIPDPTTTPAPEPLW